jgi:NAD(P)-dependent dehydrogenase (short-subunit alcohol dehydrogenase family)
LVIGAAFLEAGGQVALADIRVDQTAGLSRVLSRYGERAAYLRANLIHGEDVDRLVDSVRPRFGVDILVNNAGVAPSIVRRNFVVEPVRFWEHTEEHTQNFFALNAIAPFRPSHASGAGYGETRLGPDYQRHHERRQHAACRNGLVPPPACGRAHILSRYQRPA